MLRTSGDLKVRMLASTSVIAVALGTILAQPAMGQEKPADAGGAPAIPSGDTSSGGSGGAIEEIVVTAEKRSENIREVPIAISSLSEKTLEEQQINDIEDVQRVTPSLQAGFKIGTTEFVAIRGMGAQLYQLAAEPAVAVSQDGIVITSQNAVNLDFFDTAHVEVLRGPQGTISGRNAVAGAVNVYSNEPTRDFEGELSQTIGNYGRFTEEGYVSGPVADDDKLTARLAFRSDQDDGWLRNTLQNTNLGTVDKFQLRGSLLWKTTDDFEALLVVDAYRDRSTTFTLAANDPLKPGGPTLASTFGSIPFSWANQTAALDDPGTWDISRYLPSLRLKWTLGPDTTVTSTTGYLHLDYDTRWDLDGSSLPLYSWNPQAAPLFVVDQYSEELTLITSLSDKIDLTAGGLYVHNNLRGNNDLGDPFDGLPVTGLTDQVTQKLDSYSVYGQVRYKILPDLKLSAGARYTDDTKSYSGSLDTLGSISTQNANGNWHSITPQFSAVYGAGDNLDVYATISKGFKSGGFLTYSDPAEEFGPETAWNYETGFKGAFFDNRLTTSVSAYYMRYNGLQQSINSFTTGQTIVGGVVNAKTATIKGVELELHGKVTDALRVNFSGDYLDAHYGQLLSVDSVNPQLGIQDFAGKRLVRAPALQFDLSADYSFDLNDKWQAVLTPSYSWQSRIYFDYTNNPAISQGAYGLLNFTASAQSRDGLWKVTLYGKNLTDQFYLTHEVTYAERNLTYGGINIGDPRMFGIKLTRMF